MCAILVAGTGNWSAGCAIFRRIDEAPALDSSETIPTPFLQKLGELFSAEEVLGAGRRLGVIQRARKIDLPALVEATVLALSRLARRADDGVRQLLVDRRAQACAVVVL